MPNSNIRGDSPNMHPAHSTDGISLVSALHGFSGYTFNPQALLKATNYLRKVGQNVALETLRKYCGLAAQQAMPSPENAVLVARILFVRTDGGAVLPRLPLGQPDLAEPKEATALPLFPLYIHQGLPLLLISGYTLGGEPSPPSEYIEWCAIECDIRSEPLTPPDNPLASVDQFLESDFWKGVDPSGRREGMLRLQVLRAVSNLYPIEREEEVALLSATTTHEAWRKCREAIASLHVKWNGNTNEYD